MHHEGNHKSAQQQAGEEGGDTATNNLRITKGGDPWFVIQIVGDLILGLLASILGATGHQVLAIGFSCASLCVAFAIISNWFTHSFGKRRFIWGTYTFLVFCLSLIAVIWGRSILRNEERERLEGVLVPANEPMPTIDARTPIRDPIPADAIRVFLGATLFWAQNFPITAIDFRGRKLIVISRNLKGATISADFFGENGNIVASISSNRFTINHLNHFSKERPDRSTLIVKDQQNVEVLNVRFVNSHCIRLLGHLRIPGCPDVIMTTNTLSFNGNIWHGGGMGMGTHTPAGSTFIRVD